MSNTKRYKLINPLIIGTFTTEYIAETPIDAANEFWVKLSDTLSGNVPKFAFTLQNLDTDNLYHFIVKEKVSNNSTAKFKIEPLDVKPVNGVSKTEQNEKFIQLSEKEQLRIQSMINKNNNNDNDDDIDKRLDDMIGGRKKRYRDYDDYRNDWDDDSDDFLDDLKYLRNFSKPRPLSYFWYMPNIYGLTSLYSPTFVYPNLPYVQIYLPVN